MNSEFNLHEKAVAGYHNAIDAYERGCPSYPKVAVDYLVKTLNITANSTVLDLGASSGKFS